MRHVFGIGKPLINWDILGYTGIYWDILGYTGMLLFGKPLINWDALWLRLTRTHWLVRYHKPKRSWSYVHQLSNESPTPQV